MRINGTSRKDYTVKNGGLDGVEVRSKYLQGAKLMIDSSTKCYIACNLNLSVLVLNS